MKRRLLLAGLISTVLLACVPQATPTLIVTIPATVLPSATIQPTKTLRPTLTPTFPPPTMTPIQLDLRVTDDLVNCRLGPSMVYAPVDELHKGQFARAIGRNDTSTWWYIRDPGNPNGVCWIARSTTEIEGDTATLPVIGIPFVSVTKIRIKIEPTRIYVKCDQFPQNMFFEAELTTNGPAIVKWKWEASTGFSSNEFLLAFEEAGTRVVNDYYQIPVANDYWIKIYILKPNTMAEQVNFPVNCSP